MRSTALNPTLSESKEERNVHVESRIARWYVCGEIVFGPKMTPLIKPTPHPNYSKIIFVFPTSWRRRWMYDSNIRKIVK